MRRRAGRRSVARSSASSIRHFRHSQPCRTLLMVRFSHAALSAVRRCGALTMTDPVPRYRLSLSTADFFCGRAAPAVSVHEASIPHLCAQHRLDDRLCDVAVGAPARHQAACAGTIAKPCQKHSMALINDVHTGCTPDLCRLRKPVND